MTVITSNSAAVAASSTQSTSSTSYKAGSAELSIGDLTIMLQEVFQKMRDALQKQTVSQSINSFELAKTSVTKKQDSAEKNYKANFTNGIIGVAFGGFGGGIGLLSAGKSMMSSHKAGNLYKPVKPDINEYKGDELTFKKDLETYNKATQSYNEYANKYGVADASYYEKKAGTWSGIGPMGSAVSQLGGAIGPMATSGISKEATMDQVSADYIKDSQNAYDKQRDNDVNNMRMFSQKITEVTRSLTDLHGATLSALNWK